MNARILVLLPLLLAGPAVGQEAETPLIFFRDPDPKTQKRIEDELISGRGEGLASGTRDKRSAARRELVGIGPWTVPYLNAAIWGRKSDRNNTIRRNAVMALARILDPRCLPELREVAANDPDKDVRLAACLALGLFRKPDDSFRLQQRLEAGDRGAALALAKLRDAAAATILVSAVRNPPRDEHVAAAALIAAAVASPLADAVPFLEDQKKILRRTAATVLLIRPLPPAKAPALLAILRNPGREDKDIRALQVHALGAIRARGPEVREALLKIATSREERNEPQVAALTELAYEWGVLESYARLRGHYLSVRGKNDPVVAACIHALLRTGEPKAVDDVLKAMRSNSSFIQFYAAGSLLHLVATSANPHPREEEIFHEIESLRRTGDKALERIVNLAARVRPEKDPAKRGEMAEAGFEEVGDPKGLHLWDWSREERAWALVNRLIPHVLELDDVLDKPQGEVKGDEGMSEDSKGGTGASPDEEDLLDFLGERPYYGPEDLGEG